MIKQPLFAVSQLIRADRFSVSTYLVEENGERFFVKRANTPQSKGHLVRMIETRSSLMSIKALTDLTVPVPIKKLGDDSIQFPCIIGDSVERLLVMSILEMRNDDAIAIIDKLLSIVDSLPSRHCNPCDSASFSRIFRDAYNDETSCVKLGVVDLNLDNLIEDKEGRWHLIDYEWVFNFPIPRDYISRRFFYWFFIQRYQDLLGYHTERIEHVCIGPGISVPAFIYAKYPWAFEQLGKVIRTEAAFQEYVLGKRSSLEQISFFNPVKPCKAIKRSLLEESLERPDLLEQIAQLETIGWREEELRLVQSTRLYRIAREVLKVRSRISERVKGLGRAN